jgi:hypothetical protein
MAPKMKGISVRPVPRIVPTSILHGQHPRNSIVILERLPLLPHTITQLNALRNRAMLQLILRRTLIADLDETIETRREKARGRCYP